MRELLYEAGRALPWVRLFRRNVLRLKIVDARSGKDRMVIAGIPGQCDLYFYTYGGRCGEVEIKSQNGRLTPEQRAWRDWCQAGQIPWLCLWPWPSETSAETVQRWVEAIRLVAGPSVGSLIPVLDPEQTGQTSGSAPRRPARLAHTRSMPLGPLPASPSTSRTRGRASRRFPSPPG